MIPEGKASAQATSQYLPLTAIQVATITAQAGGVELDRSARDRSGKYRATGGRLSIAQSILGGRNVTGTVTLSGNAPASVSTS